MLERSGDEVAVATSIVRYQPGSAFHAHIHDLGEEFLVLRGTFSDEYGDYPPGTYVRNPPRSSHAPFSRDGCVIFVKLRQMNCHDVGRVTVFPADHRWSRVDENREEASLYSEGHGMVSLIRLGAGARIAGHSIRGGVELFVMEGSVRLMNGGPEILGAWSWLRHPGRYHPELASENGALLWVKRGHLSEHTNLYADSDHHDTDQESTRPL